MKRIVSLLCLLACLLGTQARANPANCDGDMTTDQTEFLEYVVGLHPILFGGPVAILQSCERVKKFLSTLSSLGVSKRSASVSDEQVRSALDGMGLTPSDASACLRRLDMTACKRYFGFGSSTAVEAPAKTALTLARAKIKRDEVLLKDRELASNLVPICKSIMTAQTCQSRLLAIENLRDDVARLNQDPELMAFIPPITLDSPDLMAQTGWERQAGGGAWYNRAGNQADQALCPELTRLINGLVANAPERARERIPQFKSACAERDPSYAAWLQRWDTQLAEASRKPSLKVGTYVRTEDCERLSRQIDGDLRARPKEDPPSLSFFEVECAAGGNEKYAGQLASWKQALASRKGMDLLNQWDGDVRKAETAQKKVWDDEDKRAAAAQRQKAEEVIILGNAPAIAVAQNEQTGKIRPSIDEIPIEYLKYVEDFLNRHLELRVGDSHYNEVEWGTAWNVETLLNGTIRSIKIEKVAIEKRQQHDFAGGCVKIHEMDSVSNVCNYPVSVAYCLKISASGYVGACEKGHLATTILGAKWEINLHAYSGGSRYELIGCNLPAIPINLNYDPKIGRMSGQCGTPKNLRDVFPLETISRAGWALK